MTIRSWATAALALLLAVGSADAAELTLENLTSADIIAVTADPGEVLEFRRVGAGTRRTFEVAMPEGQCELEVELHFSDGTTSAGATDVCAGGGVRLTEEYR